MKMTRISIKSNLIISVLAALSFVAFIIVENSKIFVKQNWYDDKLVSSQKTERAEKTLKNFIIGGGVFIDAVNDPNETALIGQKYTAITTDEGNLESKLSSTNPNFAAVFVELFKKAGLKEGDCVAAGLTGSFPGINIAFYAALEQLNLKPIIISSVGASNWGANDPYFTWLDMEKVLNEAGIFKTSSVAASYGGGQDIGRGLSPEGRKLLGEAIQRNGKDLIYDENLRAGIEKRLQIYDKYSGGKPIKAYVNIGGGIASLGHSINGDLIPTGLSMQLPMKNYPVQGVIIKMAQRHIPVIHILNINGLLKEYGLPDSPAPLPKPGTGEIFVTLKYDMTITALITACLIAVLSVIIYFDRKTNRLGSDIIESGERNYEKEQIHEEI